jgi:hypothetical protein
MSKLATSTRWKKEPMVRNRSNAAIVAPDAFGARAAALIAPADAPPGQ